MEELKAKGLKAFSQKICYQEMALAGAPSHERLDERNPAAEEQLLSTIVDRGK